MNGKRWPSSVFPVRIRRRFGLVAAVACCLVWSCGSFLHAGVLHDWRFEESAGTGLNHSRNAIQPFTFWTQPLGDSWTTGEETFRIQRNGSGQNSRFDVGAAGAGDTVYLIADIAGWDFSSVTGSNPQLRFSFMNGLAAATPGETTAEMRLSRLSNGQVTLQARADGAGGQTSAAVALFSDVQMKPVRLVLGYNRSDHRYEVGYRIGAGPWQPFYSGFTSSLRSAPSARMYVLGDFNGNGRNFLDLDRVLVTTSSPFATEATPVVLNEIRAETGTVWDLDGGALVIGNAAGALGAVTVTEGGELRSGFAVVGAGSGAEGRVEIGGAGSLWAVEDGDVSIGSEPGSVGAVEVKGGASARFSEAIGELSGFGPGRVFVGHGGEGALRILEGGTVLSGNAVYVGSGSGAFGEVEIAGGGSRLEIGSNLRIAANVAGVSSGGAGSVAVGDGAELTVGGDAMVQAGGTFLVAEGGDVFVGGRLDLAAGGSVELDGGNLAVDGALVIEAGGVLDWTGGAIAGGDLIAGIEAVPAGLRLALVSRDSFVRNAGDAPIALGAESGIEGMGTVFQPVDFGNGGGFLRGSEEASIRLFGSVTGSGTIERARIFGEVFPGGDGVTLREVSFADEGTVWVVVGENAPVVRVGAGVDFSGARLLVGLDGSVAEGAEFLLFDYLGGEPRLPAFRSVELPAGWELDGVVLRHTGAASVDSFADWAAAYGLAGEAASPLADPDGDGLDNRGEFFLGGNPGNATRDELQILAAGGAPFLRWRERMAGDAVYRLEGSDDLVSWFAKPLPSYSELFVGSSDRSGYRWVGWPVAEAESRGFFRVLADEAAALPVYPGGSWERIADPEAAGLSAGAMAEAMLALEEMDTTGFMAILGGRVLFDYGDLELISYSASVRKSILAMLYGRYVESGEIDLDATLGDLGIDDNLGLLPIEKRATVHDLLRARSGVYHPRSQTGDNWEEAPPRGSQVPGRYYLYNNWDFNALGSIFTRTTGKTPYEALETDFARVLEMEDYAVENQRWGGNMALSEHRAYYFYLSTRDMARLGYLMLRNGKWKGEQVISAEWMERMLFPWTPSGEMNPARRRSQDFGYSYLWWLLEAEEESPYFGAYAGHGAGGQFILVVPKLDLVFAHKTNSSGTSLSVSQSEFYGLADIFVQGMTQ